jgi:ComF family protein
MTSTANAWRKALDIMLPPSCPTCDRPVAMQHTFCAPCFAATVFVTDPVCLHCGLPFGSARRSGTHGACALCAADPPPWRRARAALMYEAQGRGLVLKLKHADRQDIAAVLALHMARAGRALLAEADMLVPVPLHRWRLLRRGFNQSALLAQVLGRTTGVPILLDAVRRTRRTPSLGPLSASTRRRVLEGAFTIPRRRLAQIHDRRILLIDDVMTSGATAAACTRALLDAGARHIDVLVASRVADPRG